MVVNRERLSIPWAAARTVGTAAVDSQVSSALEQLRLELRRCEQGIKSELDLCSEREPPEAEEYMAGRCRVADAWLRRFDALERKFQGD